MKTTPVQPGDSDWTRSAGTCLSEPVRDVDELKQHLIQMWSATSNAQLVKRLINGEIALKRFSKPKTNTANICYGVSLLTVVIFKACITALMNKLTYVLFHNVRWEQPSGDVGSFVANLFQYLYAKNYQHILRFDEVIAKIKGCNFFAPQCKR